MVYFKTKNPNLGIFLNGKFWCILRQFGKCTYVVYEYLVHIPTIWPFCICSVFVYVVYAYVANLVYFSRYGMFGPRKIWQPCIDCYLGFILNLTSTSSA
jgi:hypothetical protein